MHWRGLPKVLSPMRYCDGYWQYIIGKTLKKAKLNSLWELLKKSKMVKAPCLLFNLNAHNNGFESIKQSQSSRWRDELTCLYMLRDFTGTILVKLITNGLTQLKHNVMITWLLMVYLLGHRRTGNCCSWWRHQMEWVSALLALCAGNSPVPGEFPSQRPVTRSFDVLFDLRLNKRLSKQSWGWWFETPSCTLWRRCNVLLRRLPPCKHKT